MVQQKSLVTGEKPDVVIDEANGDLRLMGWERAEVLAKVEGDFTLQQSDDLVVHLRCNGDAVVRVPFGANLKIGQAHGDVRIKSVNGRVQLGAATGDLALRHVGDVTLDNHSGDVSIKHVTGDLAVNSVSGDLSLLDVRTVNITNVSGDLSARAIQGNTGIGNVSGDVSIEGAQGNLSLANVGGDLRVAGVQGNVTLGNTAGEVSLGGVQGNVNAGQIAGDLNAQGVFSIEAVVLGDAAIGFTNPLGNSKVQASGDITARFVPDANATVHIISESASITLNAPGGGRTIEEGGYDLKLGSGEVDVTLNAMGDVSIMSHAPATEDGRGAFPQFDFDFNFDFEPDLSGLNGLGDRIAQRAREAAERATASVQAKVQAKVERATRKAEEQARHADRRFQWTRRPKADEGWRAAPPPPPPAPPREPVTDEERMLILRMLEQKKITAAQAEQLLSALSGKGA